MGVRELEQDIKRYQNQIGEKQERINELENKMERLEQEYQKQAELQHNLEEFFFNKKQRCDVLYSDARGKAAQRILSSSCDIYSIKNSNALSQCYEEIKYCIRHNITAYNDELEELRGEIRNLNSRINSSRSEINRIRREEKEKNARANNNG